MKIRCLLFGYNIQPSMTFQTLNLETATGNIEASIAKGVVIAGMLSLKTTIGNVQFRMDKADVSGNVSVSLQSTTGSVNVDVAEDQKLAGNVTLDARTTTGGVNLAMFINDEVGAEIESHTDFGGISVDVQHFSGNQSSLQSNNHPADSNFLVNLRTRIGGIHISAIYESSATLN